MWHKTAAPQSLPACLSSKRPLVKPSMAQAKKVEATPRTRGVLGSSVSIARLLIIAPPILAVTALVLGSTITSMAARCCELTMAISRVRWDYREALNLAVKTLKAQAAAVLRLFL